MDGIRGVAERWKELSGEKSWQKLLEPLDIDLRRYIIHYGEMSEAAYDAFNVEKVSKYAGDCRYSMQNLFSSVGLTAANPFVYKPTKYLYATSKINLPDCFIVRSLSREAWDKESNWIGYIAVATDEGKAALGRRDIVIAFRGTVQYAELGTGMNFPLVSAADLLGDDTDFNPLVHQGWLSMYTSDDPLSQYNKTSVRSQIVEELKRLLDEYKDEEISLTLTGHSLGGALSTLCAADIIVNGLNRIENRTEKCPVTVFAFGCPRVGDKYFKDLFDRSKDVHVLRISNAPDGVPHIPPIGFSEVGQVLKIDTRKSFYVRTGNLVTWHDMELYLHGVAGTQGRRDLFRLDVKRDIALINKWTSILKDEYLVPGSWWGEKNKSMVQQEDGSWQLEDHQI
ncbi:phospholipase A1-IIgamma-like [Euphorbia lathyris]|uniref:phospholipase A1-IIgamma-like n=1 Tax=Euphorbia lathyris TaxID=212925 RepID=UPI0033132778